MELNDLLNVILDARGDLADQCDCEECPVCRAFAKLTKAKSLLEQILAEKK